MVGLTRRSYYASLLLVSHLHPLVPLLIQSIQHTALLGRWHAVEEDVVARAD